MTSIGWLHLADLHQTLRRPAWPSAQVRQQVFEDLARLHERCGPWDLVLFTGDLSMRGSPEELEQAEQTLGEVTEHLRGLGSAPCLLVVPGNHDLVRQEGAVSAHRALRRWHDDPEVRDEFWNDPESPARRLVDRAFEPFERWWNARTFPKNVRVRRGLLPGDFTATLEKDGLRFGIAGLNSAFLQVTGDDYEGRLGVTPYQLTIAAGGDVPAWVAQHDAAVLVTHHPPAWLAQAERERYEASINPAGRFCAHLSAHMHEAAPLVEAGERVQIRCGSLFGLDGFEDRRGQPGARGLGYNAARLVVAEEGARLEVFPRVWSKGGMGPAFALAELDADGAVTLPVARFPRLDDKAPAFMVERAAVRDALAAIYRSPKDVRRLAREAGFRIGKDAEGGAAIDVWQVVVSEADRSGRLDDLVKIARIEYPSDRALAETWAAYERSASPGLTRRVPARRQGSAEDKLADALFERMAELHPAAFDAALSLTSLADQVPGPAAPQPSRAIAAVRHMEKEGAVGLERLSQALTHVSGSAVVKSDPRAVMRNPGAKVRVPTKPSLTKVLTVMFSDERDFDGFVLDHFAAVYRRFTSGMNRAYRIRLLLDAAPPAEVVARLRRASPSAFSAHQRVLDYEDEDVPAAPVRSRTR